ncbi:HPP family protein [Tropicimonas sp. IMCC6043]|uniref:CBS domain-containing protein n=1 Tax=Tropicimonas sp. IMCC6043 TaxID=2510645 RepID=UPI00101BA9BF|nr:CBS domain-containing protein [Tropicimonas sp. IMCC6043]RYH10198.1 CBS domain-containing protein [Tropicimonas sp. IMCC6043]
MGLTCFDVMVSPEVQNTIHPEESVAKAFNIIKRSHARFLPVVDHQGRYLGVFTAPTLLKLILPKAALIGLSNTRVPLSSLGFMSLSEEDFHQRLMQLRNEKVGDNLSDPKNIPVTSPDTPVMEGIFLIHQYKRHVILVDPATDRFVGTVSANSLLDHVLPDPDLAEDDQGE